MRISIRKGLPVADKCGGGLNGQVPPGGLGVRRERDKVAESMGVCRPFCGP
jgi:hypothetical protein